MPILILLYETAAVNVSSPSIYADFDHVLDPSNVNDTFAVGLYRISVIDNIESGSEPPYFYIDWRTSDWSTSLDVYSKYDVGNRRFRDYYNIENINYSYQTLWDLTGNLLETDGLEDYWDNCLAITKDEDDHPRLVWGPHPTFTTTNYYIYRGISEEPVDPANLTFYHIGTTDDETYTYINNDFIIESTPTDYAYYYIKAYISSNETFSSASNIVNTSGQYVPYKIAVGYTKEVYKFDVNQNYPNPFNPSTIISWQSPVDNLVTLKVFDILGREVATLVNEFKESGSYSVDFNASTMPSGIYLYRIQIGSYIETRKLILQK